MSRLSWFYEMIYIIFGFFIIADNYHFQFATVLIILKDKIKRNEMSINFLIGKFTNQNEQNFCELLNVLKFLRH